MSALFNFQSLLIVIVLIICTCTYIRRYFPLENKAGIRGVFWKAARIGERKSQYISFFCICLGVSIIIWD
ncbi:unnamed protein product [Gordionus sp. m RMFG-2023]